MKNLDTIQRVIGWNTKKVENGFKAVAYSHDYQIDNVIHFEAVYKTRAIAARNAQKAVKFLKAKQK